MYEGLLIRGVRAFQRSRSLGAFDTPVFVAELTPHLAKQIIAGGSRNGQGLAGTASASASSIFCALASGVGAREEFCHAEMIESANALLAELGCDEAELRGIRLPASRAKANHRSRSIGLPLLQAQCAL